MLTLERRAAAVSSETVQLVLSVFSLVSMLILITFCSRCKLLKNRSSGDNCDFASPPVYDDAPDCVQFRNPAAIVRNGERHSQPAAVKGKNSRFDNASSRASAPSQMGRALPRVPADVYATIDKTRTSQIAFADEGCNALYESLDPDQDSTLEKPYNKVADLMHTRERKYDYPVFSANKVFSGRNMPEDPAYNNGSQIYTVGGSDDPYSSIASEPCRRYGDEDGSSICDPLYAKVSNGPCSSSAIPRENLETAEKEVDQLYSAVRRASLRTADNASSFEGPSRVTMDDIMEGGLERDMSIKMSQNADEESTSSREPSYRYITVRENARVIRERLRQQGQLLAPAREHYYSVIGNEYETVGDVPSTSYDTVVVPPQAALSVNLSMPHAQEFVPPPPTSPIPDRTPNDNGIEGLEASRLSDTPHTDSENGDLYAVVSKPRVPASKSDGGLHSAVSRGSSSESHGGR